MNDIKRLGQTNRNSPTLFLLGGADLEMTSIKKLLIDFGFKDISETADLSCDLGFAKKYFLNSTTFNVNICIKD